MIYRSLLFRTSYIKCVYNTERQSSPLQNFYVWRSPSDSDYEFQDSLITFSLSILRVYREVYKEALPIFYRHNEFRIRQPHTALA
jgi:hypothetical protein